MLLWPFNKYPGTDYETFNWEWILHTVKTYTQKVDDFIENITDTWNDFRDNITDTWNDFKDWTTGEIDQMHDDFAEYVNITEGALNTGAIANGAITFAKLADALKIVVTPEMYGAIGDGIADDSTAFQAALDSGYPVFLKNKYAVNNIQLTKDVEITGDENAEIIHTGIADSDYLLNNDSYSLSIKNVKIDQSQASARPYLLALQIPHECVVNIEGCTFNGIKKLGKYVTNFGGLLTVKNNKYYNTVWGTASVAPATLMNINSGEPGHKGQVSVVSNYAYSEAPDASSMTSCPGGFFMACRDDHPNNPEHGNGSSAYFADNYFRGYGMSHGINEIYPIHFYPQWDGVRIIGNRFEDCMHGAMSTKSCTNVVVSGNTFKNGITHTNQNLTAIAGVFAIHLTYHQNATTEGAVVTGNIIDGAGSDGTNKKAGITVRGTDTATLTDKCVISDNIIKDCYNAIGLYNTGTIIVNGNIAESTGTTCILQNAAGYTEITNNDFTNSGTTNPLATNSGCEAADVVVDGNVLHSNGATGVLIRSVHTAKVINNTCDAPGSGSQPIRIERYGSTGGNVSRAMMANNEHNTNSNYRIEMAAVDSIAGYIIQANFDNTKPAPAGTQWLDTATGILHIRKNNSTWTE